MKPRLIVNGHSLLSHHLAKETKGALFNRNRAFCSCGAWADIIPCSSANGQNKARRNWHDQHKIEVLRSQGKLEED